jgi:DNA-binding winged helix-turn-helix (wHTH) protein/tetratricopeptide (TPR) repeat protein
VADSAAPKPTPDADFFEFGPFRLDVPAHALYRGDEFIAVTPKAFDTLAVLVEEAGRVVTKDELLQRVWPDAFVEEGSIANHISTLRKILNPYFDGDGPIATVSRRGYRFTAPVKLRNAQAQIAVVADTGVSDPSAFAAGVIGTAAKSNTRVFAIAAGAVLAVTAIAIATAMRVATAAPADARVMRRAVAVLPMHNLSGAGEHAWFSSALAEAISTQLNAGGALRLVYGLPIAELQQQLGTPLGATLSRKQLDLIGRNLGCDLILSGTYLQTSRRIRVDLRLDDIASGAPVASVSVEDAEDKLLDLVVAATRELRSELGLAPPLPGEAAAARAALSSNPHALRSYFLGLEALRNHEIPRSIELLMQATDEDPSFALAHSIVSTSWRVIGYDDKSEAAAKKAFEHSARLGREDQLLVHGAYYAVIGDVPKAIEKFQALWNFFPDDIAYGIRLTHQQLLGGKLDEARRTIDQIRALPPPADTDPRVDVVESNWFFRKAQYADAIRVATAGAEKAKRRKSNQLLAILTMTQGRASNSLGDIENARRYFAAAQQLFEGLGDSGGAAEAIRADAVVLLTRDQVAEAEKRLDQALQMALRMNHQRLLMEIRINRSAAALRFGKLALAESDAEAALVSAREVQNPSAIARALTALGSAEAARGDIASARAHLEEAERVGREIGEPAVFMTAVKQKLEALRVEPGAAGAVAR